MLTPLVQSADHGGFALATFMGYAIVSRWGPQAGTPQTIVFGGAAWPMPRCSAGRGDGGDLSRPTRLLLFLIIFGGRRRTSGRFALYRRKDYAKPGCRCCPGRNAELFTAALLSTPWPCSREPLPCCVRIAPDRSPRPRSCGRHLPAYAASSTAGRDRLAHAPSRDFNRGTSLLLFAACWPSHYLVACRDPSLGYRALCVAHLADGVSSS